MEKRKIYVVGNAYEYANWMEGKLTRVMEEADLVVFTGGEDVTPDFYNEKKNPKTGNNLKRDIIEKIAFDKARALNKHIIGICRGSQFLCVANGGKLVQHQQNPYYVHPITLKGGGVINISSTHHQAAYPFNLPDEDYEILGWTSGISSFHEDGNQKELNPSKECEIVYYPKTKCLGIQGHPEYHFNDRENTLVYLQELLKNFLNNKL